MEQQNFIPNFYKTITYKDRALVLAKQSKDENLLDYIKHLIMALQNNETVRSVGIYQNIAKYISTMSENQDEILNILFYWTANSNGSGGYNFTQHSDPSPNKGGCWACCDGFDKCCDCCC